MTNIYTKTGDKGMSSLYDGKRLSKGNEIFDALGDVDELNAAIGIAIWNQRNTAGVVNSQLEYIQNTLLHVGASLATPSDGVKKDTVKFNNGETEILEKWIDEHTEKLPKLREFILPRHQLHMARAVCRRAERNIVKLGYAADPELIRYMNRLSDYLFTAARVLSEEEILWKKNN